jgi:hypothetical protein
MHALMLDDDELKVDLESEALNPADAARCKLKTAAASCFGSFKYPAKPSESVVTMPLLFERVVTHMTYRVINCFKH